MQCVKCNISHKFVFELIDNKYKLFVKKFGFKCTHIMKCINTFSFSSNKCSFLKKIFYALCCSNG